MQTLEGFILAGGASSRMGKDKSRLTLGDRTLLETIADSIIKVTGSVVVVGTNSSDLGLNSIADVHEKWGALGGLHSALAVCRAQWALITACDLPFATPDLFNRLATLTDSFEAVAPIQSNGYPQPLCALYRVNPCLQRCEQLIQSGERRPVELLRSVNTRWVVYEELQDLNGSERFFDNINTPADYSRAVERREPAKG